MGWIRNTNTGGLLVAMLYTSAIAQQQPTMPIFRQFTAGQRLGITGGRIILTGPWQSAGASSSSGEQIISQGNGISGSIAYQQTTPQEKLLIEFDSAGMFHYSREPKRNLSSTRIEVTQTPGGMLTLLCSGPEGKRQECRGTTIWHLFIMHPQESRPLAALLDDVRPQWQSSKMTAAIEAELLKAAAGKNPEREKWAALVGQLGDDQFMKREAADRKLRAEPAAFGYLQRLDINQLDAEQRLRLRRILKLSERQKADDTAEQVAAWLLEDPMIWLALLSRSDATVRKVAAKQLASILGELIPVDPAADPAAQYKQRDQLRARIEQARSAKTPAKG
jgi:hypothetical protein